MSDETGLEDVPVPPNTERERRFLVRDLSILERTAGWNLLEQAYVWSADGYAIRVRRALEQDNENNLKIVRASLTAKGPRYGDQREEFETEISEDFAGEVIDRCDHVIRKKRHDLVDSGSDEVWAVDVFLDANEGLVIAELEGGNIRRMPVPPWAAREITSDTRYNNEELALYPVSAWDSDEWRVNRVQDG